MREEDGQPTCSDPSRSSAASAAFGDMTGGNASSAGMWKKACKRRETAAFTNYLNYATAWSHTHTHLHACAVCHVPLTCWGYWWLLNTPPQTLQEYCFCRQLTGAPAAPPSRRCSTATNLHHDRELRVTLAGRGGADGCGGEPAEEGARAKWGQNVPAGQGRQSWVRCETGFGMRRERMRLITFQKVHRSAAAQGGRKDGAAAPFPCCCC